MRLKDRVAIITGGAGGIGKAFVIGFAREGAKVVIADINLPDAKALASSLEKDGFEALALGTDVSSLKSTREMADKTIERFGKIDILVNNAALLLKDKDTRALIKTSICDIDPDEWDRVLDINLKGVFLCSRATIPYMKKQGGGKIINLASSLAFTGRASMAHYVASKGGILSLTRCMARECGEYKINVNGIAPGATVTEQLTPDRLQLRAGEVPYRALKRIEYPEDLVGAAIFLASPDSDFITGETIAVDGGVAMH